MKPLCFVLMPFGRKRSASGLVIDFDDVYDNVISPAVSAADMEPLRADEELAGGIIHKPMFERLILCEFAIADLTTANPNVFYELGIRHAIRRCTTVLMFAKGIDQLPFDVAPLRALPYEVDGSGIAQDKAQIAKGLSKRLHAARDAETDSPIFQLVDGFPDIQRLKTDVFRDRVNYSQEKKRDLRAARLQDINAIRAIESSLGNIADVEAGVIIDLYLSYRAVKAWADMIQLVKRMSPPLSVSVMVQEQLALALNRAGQGEEAEHVLLDLLARRGSSSETCGILGRVYKDRWELAYRAGNDLLARGLLEKAIDAYLKGFQADWRDAYPGINALTLMEALQPPDVRRVRLAPVVRYAVERRLESGHADYWDQATMVELSILAGDEQTATRAATAAIALVREKWEPETTARNLRLIRELRSSRGESFPWADSIENALVHRAQ